MLTKNRMRWLGHVSRMENDRPTKMLLYGELAEGTRPVGRPKLRYKDTCKNALKCGGILDVWQDSVNNRLEWRNSVCGKVNERRVKRYEKRRDQRRRRIVDA